MSIEQTEQPPAQPTTQEPAPEEYGIVEIMGHRRHVGRIMEVEKFGAKMLRVDVPKEGDFEKGYTSHFYGGGSIFGITPTDLATVRRANAHSAPPALGYTGRSSFDGNDDLADEGEIDEDEVVF